MGEVLVFRARDCSPAFPVVSTRGRDIAFCPRAGSTYQQCVELLPGRNIKGIATKAYYSAGSVTGSLPIRASPHRVWTAQEREILRTAVEQGQTCKECAELLPGRSIQAITQRRRVLDRKQHSLWHPHIRKVLSSDVIEIIRLARQGLGRDEIQERMPHRTIRYIVKNAYSHGIYFARKQRIVATKWTAAEDRLLSQEGGQQTLVEVHGKTLDRINRRRKYLKLAGPTAHLPSKPWTTGDVETAFHKYTSGVPFPDIAKLLGRSMSAVYGKVYRESKRRHGTKADHSNSLLLRMEESSPKNSADQNSDRGKTA